MAKIAVVMSRLLMGVTLDDGGIKPIMDEKKEDK